MADARFQITLYPLEEDVSLPLCERMEESSCNLVRGLYEDLNEIFCTTSRQETLKKLDQSLFGCCFPEGMVLFAVFPWETRADGLCMKGFFIPREDLRTAWRLYRESLIYMAAAGWNDNTVQILPEEAIGMLTKTAVQKLERAGTLPQYQALTAQLGNAPMHFALTNLPPSKLRVAFPMLHQSAPMEEESDGSTILIQPEAEQRAWNQLGGKDAFDAHLFLCCGTEKSYLEQKKASLKDVMGKAELKQWLADEKARAELFPEGPLWYFRYEETDGTCFVYLMPQAYLGLCQELQAGTAGMAELHRCISSVKKRHDKEMELIHAAKQAQPPQEEKGGLFGLFGKKKKNQ